MTDKLTTTEALLTELRAEAETHDRWKGECVCPLCSILARFEPAPTLDRRSVEQAVFHSLKDAGVSFHSASVVPAVTDTIMALAPTPHETKGGV